MQSYNLHQSENWLVRTFQSSGRKEFTIIAQLAVDFENTAGIH